MSEIAAQHYHEQQQELARYETEGTDTPHYGRCWCCCTDCGFDYGAVVRGEGRPGQEFDPERGAGVDQ